MTAIAVAPAEQPPRAQKTAPFFRLKRHLWTLIRLACVNGISLPPVEFVLPDYLDPNHGCLRLSFRDWKGNRWVVPQQPSTNIDYQSEGHWETIDCPWWKFVIDRAPAIQAQGNGWR